MADEDEKAEEPKKKSKLIIIIIIASVLVLGGGGAAAFFLLSGGSETPAESSDSEAAAEEGGEKTEEKEESKEKEETAEADGEKDAEGKEGEGAEEKVDPDRFTIGATFGLKPFNINLGNPLENRYLRLEIAIEYKQGEKQKAELQARIPQLRDAVISVASRKTREFLLSPDGKNQMRLEILNRINQYMDQKVESIFITDLLIE